VRNRPGKKNRVLAANIEPALETLVQETDMNTDTQKIAEAVASAITPIVEETIANELEAQGVASGNEQTGGDQPDEPLVNEEADEKPEFDPEAPSPDEEDAAAKEAAEREERFLEDLKAAREKTTDAVEIFAMLGLELTGENIQRVFQGLQDLQAPKSVPVQTPARRGSRVAWLKEAMRSAYGTGTFTVKAAAEKFEVTERDIRVAIDSARAKQGQATVENGGRGTGQFRFTI
jgi:predicted DNA-binding protein (UPF0251 family)